jgi:molybdopterin/thiamine biosynthesis adenylyltransferase
MEFTDEVLERYSRQILLKDVGIEGQEKLAQARVLVLGVGGLGTPAATYLAAAGVGKLGLVDADVVDLSNLQRQILHHTPDLGVAKVESAAAKLRALNPHVEIVATRAFIQASNVLELLKGYDFVIDGTDNFAAKFLINDACVLTKTAFVHGGILRFEGQLMTVLPGQTACYRCVFPSPPPPGLVPTCSQAGILGAVAGILGTLQATEALKFALGAGQLHTNAFLSFDARSLGFRKVAVKRNPKCPVCGEAPRITAPYDEEPPRCDLTPSHPA